MRVLLLVAAAALFVGACGGADEGGSSDEPVLGGKMSVEELAGKMAVSEREAGQVLDQLGDAGCAKDAAQPVCGTILDTSSYVADTVVIVLGRDLPAGVEGLADESRAAAQAVVDKHKEWDAADCATSTTEECTTLSQDLTGAVESLHKQLAEWSQHAK